MRLATNDFLPRTFVRGGVLWRREYTYTPNFVLARFSSLDEDTATHAHWNGGYFYLGGVGLS
jgi:hypothetical protein